MAIQCFVQINSMKNILILLMLICITIQNLIIWFDINSLWLVIPSIILLYLLFIYYNKYSIEHNGDNIILIIIAIDINQLIAIFI